MCHFSEVSSIFCQDHDGNPYCEADYHKLFGPKGIGFGSTLCDTGIATEKPSENDEENVKPVSIRDRLAAFEKKAVPAAVARGATSSARFQSSAPKCPACSKSVYAAEEIKGLGRSWHVLCFCCKACGKSLRGGQYKDHDGHPYCDADYRKLFGPKGLGFGTTLGDTGVAAELPGTCTPVSETGYPGTLRERLSAFEGQASPEKAEAVPSDASLTKASKVFVASSAPKCPACSKSVYAAEEIKGLGQSWHVLCFCCKACGRSLRGGQYKDHEGQPYCEADYNKLFGPKGIGFGTTLGDTGIAVHAAAEAPAAPQPEAECTGGLKDMSSVFEEQDKPARTDAVSEAEDEGTDEASTSLARTAKSALQPSAPKCPACNKSVYAAEQIKGLGKTWHVLCFCCKACGKSLRGGQYKDHEGHPYCEADYSKLYGPKGIGFGSTLADTGIVRA